VESAQNVKNFKPDTRSSQESRHQQPEGGKDSGVSESPDFADPEEFF
jgi:hypothetical protein